MNERLTTPYYRTSPAQPAGKYVVQVPKLTSGRKT